ncbi:hypothetical protein PBRA_008222 [Plasmodiophora brassicae]|uniref:Uncharacterized protein n=1 Tax=Plasmodiophora brassicae TaxID=37360 RepID=A0A0G4IZZ8_PLABS|nr:hypothetical protein PBRA_008222 [Plasmodiophora brassicae]
MAEMWDCWNVPYELLQHLSNVDVVELPVVPMSRSSAHVTDSTTETMQPAADALRRKHAVVDIVDVPACWTSCSRTRPPSHQQVCCPVGHCRSMMRRDSLQYHIESQHCHVQVVNSKGKRASSSTSQTSIFNFFKKPRLENEPIAIESGEINAVLEEKSSCLNVPVANPSARVGRTGCVCSKFAVRPGICWLLF